VIAESGLVLSLGELSLDELSLGELSLSRLSLFLPSFSDGSFCWAFRSYSCVRFFYFVFLLRWLRGLDSGLGLVFPGELTRVGGGA
jgi:hypothetical protein